jgi:predicted transcriptional regulator
MQETAKTNSVKEQVIQMIQRLPDDCTLEQIQYHLYVRQQIEQGLADIDAGRVISHKEVKRRVAEWRKSSGRRRR